MFFDLTLVIQSLAISLGVGGSTLAIINFFVAIWDGKINPNERRMMGVVYIVLRVAMAIILLTTIIITASTYFSSGSLSVFHAVTWSLLVILFTNAILMTKHILPSAFGPAIQASAWYSLGVFSTIRLVGWNFTYLQFVIFYFVLVFIAITLINLIMIHCKNLQRQKQKGS